MPGVVMCAQCSARFAAGVKFCGRCGGTIFLPVTDAAPAPGAGTGNLPASQSGSVVAHASHTTCQQCGNKNPIGTKFCGRCGATITSAAATPPGPSSAPGSSKNLAATPLFANPAPRPQHQAFCVPCGTSYPPGTRFCGRCGNTI